jgi:hypothetical protein
VLRHAAARTRRAALKRTYPVIDRNKLNQRTLNYRPSPTNIAGLHGPCPKRPYPQGEAVLAKRVCMIQVEQEAIRERAHQLWEAAGRPDGKEDHFWLEAERQLKEELIRHELKTPDSL